MARVLVVSAHSLERLGLAGLLRRGSRHVRLAGTAGSCREARLQVERLEPDVVFADAGAAGEGFVLCHDLAQLARPPRVVVQVPRCGAGPRLAAWIAGAAAVVEAEASPTELIGAIECAAEGRVSVRRPQVREVREAGARLSGSDLSVFGMCVYRVPAHEISRALRLDPLEAEHRIRSLVAVLAAPGLSRI